MAEGGLLALVRHGQSTDNEHNLFSGWRDPDLTARGVAEARAAGVELARRSLVFERAFTSCLRRANRTLDLILGELAHADLPVVKDIALNERHYGELHGLNKDEARSTFGAERVHCWRKSYEGVPPGGESLAMTAARTMPFYETRMRPHLLAGERILVVAHGNSLRSIIKHLDGMSDTDIETANIATGEILLYEMRPNGAVGPRTSIKVAPQLAAP